MILYHGSIDLVKKPEIRRRTGVSCLDFGVGFYTTTSFDQAKRWAKIKMRRENKSRGFVSVYEFDFERASAECTVKKFDGASLEWLAFVSENRRGLSVENSCDMHIGPVADDNVYQTIRLFETGAYDAEYTVKRLKTEALHDQWAFHTEKVLAFLSFVRSHEVV